jgi:uncharacterized membrane protein
MSQSPWAPVILSAGSAVALLSAAVWLGGLVALGALVAPVVFSTVAMPASADAMVIVFRRFDVVAMTCAALVLCAEALRRSVRRSSFARVDFARASVAVAAAAAAVFQGTRLSPRIAELHAAGAVRGFEAGGMELSRLHDVAETCGKAQVLLLVLLVVLHVVTLSADPSARRASAVSAS